MPFEAGDSPSPEEHHLIYPPSLMAHSTPTLAICACLVEQNVDVATQKSWAKPRRFVFVQTTS